MNPIKEKFNSKAHEFNYSDYDTATQKKGKGGIEDALTMPSDESLDLARGKIAISKQSKRDLHGHDRLYINDKLIFNSALKKPLTDEQHFEAMLGEIEQNGFEKTDTMQTLSLTIKMAALCQQTLLSPLVAKGLAQGKGSVPGMKDLSTSIHVNGKTFSFDVSRELLYEFRPVNADCQLVEGRRKYRKAKLMISGQIEDLIVNKVSALNVKARISAEYADYTSALKADYSIGWGEWYSPGEEAKSYFV
jgi:hypothetical protein